MLEIGKRRAGNRQAAIGARADQRGELVAGERDQLVGRGKVGARGGNGGVGLLELGACVEADADAIRNQLLGGAAQIDRRRQHVVLGVETGQIGVSCGNRRGQHQLRLILFDPGGLGLRGRGGEGGPVAAPQVDVEREIHRRLADVAPAMRDELGGIATIIALLFVADIAPGIE